MFSFLGWCSDWALRRMPWCGRMFLRDGQTGAPKTATPWPAMFEGPSSGENSQGQKRECRMRKSARRRPRWTSRIFSSSFNGKPSKNVKQSQRRQTTSVVDFCHPANHRYPILNACQLERIGTHTSLPTQLHWEFDFCGVIIRVNP